MILILTQSSNNGSNYKIAKDCAKIIKTISGIDPDIKNFNEFQCNRYCSDSDKIIMVVPEWNGSFPYTLKKLIDDSGYPSLFEDKQIYLVGTSGGLGGNMQGLSHLSDVLSFIGADVYKQRIYISRLKNFDQNDPQTLASTQKLAEMMEILCSNMVKC